MSKKIIFGLSGHPSGGKDTVAKYLVAHYGFKHISTGDGLRAYIRQHNLGELDRENMNKVVTELRKKFGNDFLVRDVLDNNSSDRLVLSGLRSSGEAKAIKTAGGILVAVDATMQTRYRRALARGRIGDEISFATFAAEQNKEEAEVESVGKGKIPVFKKLDLHHGIMVPPFINGRCHQRNNGDA